MSNDMYKNVPKTRIQAINRVEMIYENEEDFNTNRQQPLQCKGRECVRMRRYRTATVCLVLLCVLLLTAVIVLCMKFTNLLQSETENPCDRFIEQDQCTNNPKWITHNLSSYYISSEWRNWSESRQDCLQRGADLLIINDKEEQDFIIEVTSGNKVWIGLTLNRENGLWTWVDGTNITYDSWKYNEPNNGIPNEDCAISHYGWADYPCHYTVVWICEKGLDV